MTEKLLNVRSMTFDPFAFPIRNELYYVLLPITHFYLFSTRSVPICLLKKHTELCVCVSLKKISREQNKIHFRYWLVNYLYVIFLCVNFYVKKNLIMKFYGDENFLTAINTSYHENRDLSFCWTNFVLRSIKLEKVLMIKNSPL